MFLQYYIIVLFDGKLNLLLGVEGHPTFLEVKTELSIGSVKFSII